MKGKYAHSKASVYICPHSTPKPAGWGRKVKKMKVAMLHITCK